MQTITIYAGKSFDVCLILSFFLPFFDIFFQCMYYMCSMFILIQNVAAVALHTSSAAHVHIHTVKTNTIHSVQQAINIFFNVYVRNL